MSCQAFMSKDLGLLESGHFADATITCGDRTWSVHKNIMCRCEWFRKAFTGNFEEARKSNVNIPSEDFSPELVDSVVKFIYSGVINDMEELNTNDSMVDACVRLWVIADFLLFSELQHEAVKVLEEYCDEKVRVLCVRGNLADGYLAIPDGELEVLLRQLFRGVHTAYMQYPHSMPCQDVLIGFFHGVRLSLYGSFEFSRAMSTAPREFSHELFMATIDGMTRYSKWDHTGEGEYHTLEPRGNCTYCDMSMDDPDERHAMDLTMGIHHQGGCLTTPWRCIPCFEKYGLEPAPEDSKKP